MNILVVAATQLELEPLQKQMALAKLLPSNTISLLATGIGLAATTYKLTKALHAATYDLVINVGIAGCFGSKLQLGDVCVVEQECFADLGVDTINGFVTAFEQRLVDVNSIPFTSGQLLCPYVSKFETLATLPKVKGVTLSTISGTPETVTRLQQKFSPDIESMEGAAVFYTCLCEGVPFLELRAISNQVGERDKGKWNIPLALENLTNILECLIAGKQ